MNHQYIILQSDGWYIIRDRGYGRESFGPFRWHWLACLAANF